MGRKTEVTSVHFQRCLIYPHFAVFYSLTLGKDLNGLPGLEKKLFHTFGKMIQYNLEFEEVQMTK